MTQSNASDPLREALERIARFSRTTNGACVWCGRVSLATRHAADCPNEIALAALAATPPPALDVAWAAAEAALPEDWELKLSVGGHGRRDLFTATASYCYSLGHYRENVGRARSTPFEMEHAATPAAALLALAARLTESDR